MKRIYTFSLLSLLFFSCQDYDQDVVPLVGTYEAQVISVSESFVMAISYDANDDVFIDALFDGINWAVVSGDIDDQEDDFKRIRIREQAIGLNATIEGEGFYLDNSIQLDYTIYFPNAEVEYSLVATKL